MEKVEEKIYCKYWKDYCEPEIGLNEFCKVAHANCTCSGLINHCNFGWKLKEEEKNGNE